MDILDQIQKHKDGETTSAEFQAILAVEPDIVNIVEAAMAAYQARCAAYQKLENGK